MKNKIIALALFAVMLCGAATVSAQTTNSCLNLQSTNLYYGARDRNTNGEVTLLQNFLQAKGYLNSSSSGYFGRQTYAAVKSFQRANNITPVSGYVGPLTRSVIKTISCGTAQVSLPTLSVAPADVGSTTPSITVLTPNGGEIWQAGSTQTITWLPNNMPSSQVLLEFSKGQNTVYYSYITNDGSEQITVPSDIGTGSDFKITLGYKFSNGVFYSDSSDNYFTITLPTTLPCPTSTTKPGDANCDGLINQTDYDALNKGFNSGGTLTGWQNGDFNKDGKINFDDYYIINQAFLNQTSNTQTTLLSTRISPSSAPTARIVTTSASQVTSNVVLGVFSLKVQNKSATINSMSFSLNSNNSTSLASILTNVRLSVGGQIFGSNAILANGIISFTNLSIPLSIDQWTDMTLMTDVAAGVQSNNVTVSATLNAASIVGTDQTGATIPSLTSASNITSNNTTFIQTSNQTSITVLSPNGGETLGIGSSYTIRWSSVNVPTQSNIRIGIIDMRPGNQGGDIVVVPNTGSYVWNVPQSIGAMNLTTTNTPVYKIGVATESTGPGYAADLSDNNFAINTPTCPTATTKPGDANCDGLINQTDYDALNKGFNSGGTLVGWVNGDFNKDGKINFDDYYIINQAFLNQPTSATSTLTSYLLPSTQTASIIQTIQILINQLNQNL